MHHLHLKGNPEPTSVSRFLAWHIPERTQGTSFGEINARFPINDWGFWNFTLLGSSSMLSWIFRYTVDHYLSPPCHLLRVPDHASAAWPTSCSSLWMSKQVILSTPNCPPQTEHWQERKSPSLIVLPGVFQCWPFHRSFF